jgi:hypothetical protein
LTATGAAVFLMVVAGGCGSSANDAAIARADAYAATKSLVGKSARIMSAVHIGRAVWRVSLQEPNGNRDCFYIDLDRFVAHQGGNGASFDGLVAVRC